MVNNFHNYGKSPRLVLVSPQSQVKVLGPVITKPFAEAFRFVVTFNVFIESNSINYQTVNKCLSNVHVYSNVEKNVNWFILSTDHC